MHRPPHPQPSSLFGLRQPSPGVYRIHDRANGNLFQEHLCQHMPPSTAAASAPDPVAGHCQHTPLQKVLKHSQTGLTQSLLGPLLLSPGSGVHKVLFVPFKSLCFPQSFGSSVIRCPCLSKSDSLGIPSPPVRSPGWEV